MGATINHTVITESLFTDYKAEVIAAEMIENGIQPDRILILMLGGAKRPYRKDVDEIVEEQSDYDHKEYINISTHKEGIYDKLPEGLFHSPTIAKSARTEREIIDEIKKHRAEEKNARLFFLPFEAAINELRIQMAVHESKLDKRSHNNDLVEIFASQWEIFNYLDSRQSNVFLHLLPLIHEVRDDFAIATIIFELILLLPVKIKAGNQGPIKSEVPIYSSLDNCILGVNFTTGNEVYLSGEDEITVTMGPMDNTTFHEYMPGSNKGKLVELLCDYFLPVHLDITIVFELNPTDKTTRLSDKLNDYNSTLGVCTFL